MGRLEGAVGDQKCMPLSLMGMCFYTVRREVK